MSLHRRNAIVLAVAMGVSELCAPAWGGGEGETPGKESGASVDAGAAPIAKATPSAAEVVAFLETGQEYATDAEQAQAEAAVKAAAEREPKVSRWQFGIAMFTRKRGERIAARDALRKIAENEPEVAAYQFWYGSAIFESMSEMGTFGQISWNGTGRGALEEAVRLDPNNPTFRFGLVLYYINAPGIAGGSYAKATEHAQAMLAMPDGRGEFMGHMSFAQIAASKEEWAEMTRHFTLAEAAGGIGANPESALMSHAYLLLTKKKDPDAALPVIERLAQAAKPDNTSPQYLMGVARQQRKEYEAAIESFTKVLARAPEAKNTRFAIAQCYEALGRNSSALTHYDEFIARFPDDAKAGDAKSAARKIRDALAR